MGSAKARVRILGILAMACYAIHAADSLHRGEPWNLLWACNLACLLVGLGLAGGWAGINAIGAVWLFFGIPMWLLDLANGGEFIATSVLTHVGGLILGIAGLRALGLPAGTWWKAVLTAVGMQLLSRWISPAHENLNLAASVWSGWERIFPSFAVYWACVIGVEGATFFAVERFLPRLLARETN